jgi:mannosyltransferase
MTKPSRFAEPGVLPQTAGRTIAPGTSIALGLVAITALGLLLRLYRLDAASLWADEAFSGHWIHRSLSYIWLDGLVIETTPPLYYMLLKFWAAGFGDSDFALRLFSAVASAGTIPLVFLLGLELGSIPVALSAALIFALAPMQIAYAQEARVYALVPLFFAIALFGLQRFIRGALAERPRREVGALAVFGVGAVLLIYAHATSVFTVAALSGCGGALLLARRGRAALPRFVLANAVVAVLAVPQLYAILQQAGRYDLEWIQRPDLIGLLNLANNLFIDPMTPLSLFRLASVLATVTAALLAATLLWVRFDRVTAVLLLGVPATFLAAVIAVSFWSPFLIPRIVIWIGVPLSLLAGMALLGPAPRWLRASLGMLLAACIGLGLQGVYVRTLADKEDWRGLMAELLPQLGAEDMVVIGPGTSMLAMLRYANGTFDDNGRELFRWEPKPRTPDLYQPDHVAQPIAVTSDALGQAARQGRRIWLLLRQTDWAANRGFVAGLDPQPEAVDRSHPMIVMLRW